MRTPLLLAVLLLTGCSRSEPQPPAPPRDQARAARIEKIRRDIDAKTEAANARRQTEPDPFPPAAPATNAPAERPATADLIRAGMEKLQDQAYFIGREAAHDSLQSPSTARFSLHYDPHTGANPYGFYQWQAFGLVDSQNAFGAMLRTQWHAVVKWENGLMQVTWLKVGDHATGEMPPPRLAPLANNR